MRKKFKDLPPYEELRRILDYDPETGIVRWKVRRGPNIHPGDVAGSKCSSGAYQICYQDSLYLLHRIIWKWVTGEDPLLTIDHKDVDPSNNRWENLRLATHVQQGQNRNKSPKTKNPYKGVTRTRGVYRWTALIFVDGVKHRLGTFGSPEEAHLVYKAAAIKYFGEFAKW